MNNIAQGQIECRKVAILAAVLFAGQSANCAAVTRVYFETGNFQIAGNHGTLLSGGSPTVDHDGTVMQLGYYRDVGDGVLGWVPLTGEGSRNTAFAHSTIGDSFLYGADYGVFADTWLFTAGNPATGQDLPTVGTPLSVWFFDATSIAGASAYQILSNPLWIWKAPQEPPDNPVVSMSLDDAGTKMLFNRDLPADRIIRLNQGLLVPEPTTPLLAVVGALKLMARRLRRR